MGEIEDNNQYNFKTKYDEDNDIFSGNLHNCEYLEILDFKSKFSKHNNGFSTFSNNIRSNGPWDNILDNVNSTLPIKFSVIAFQEIWSVWKNYHIPGYCKFECVTRDKNGPPNPNCGGGVGIFIDNNFKDYEILTDESVFEPHVYGSIWVKINKK